MKESVRKEALKRLSYIEGHLQGIRRMIEEDKYCPDILRQTYAVRRAIEKLEALILDGHLHTCVIDGIRQGREEEVVAELMELYSLANR
ncbi:MAG: metal-sensitive transcriptional regulator [Dehalococcoidia bacterium]|jgi:DNA-binding FrmR family transcriptional regulator|nr:metal-sensitive transcriptional regulator [Dehalococcoidia bacterium]MDW8008664.1 metal-sensitive transcriptional regulator [Chloroflexota bacterium]